MAGNPFAYEPMRLGASFLQGEAIARDREQMRQAMALRQAAEERARQENDYNQQIRPLELTGRQLALRGQMLGTVETPEDYARVLPAVQAAGLPTADLPAGNQSTAWLQFRKPQEPAQSWLPERFRPADLSPVPQGERMAPALSEATMQAPGIAPEDIPAIQRAAERGLPIVQQSKLRDADVGRQLQLANLQRNLDKDTLSRDWMAFQREAKVQGMSEAETQREFQRRMALMGYALDEKRFNLTEKTANRAAEQGKTGTEGQVKAGLFGSGIEAARGTLETLMKGGFDPTSYGSGVATWAAGTPLRGAVSENAQLWVQAVNEISNNALRYKSGASIQEQEAGREIEQNIPKPGDKPGVVRAKLATIKRIEDGLAAAAGPANWRTKGAATTGKPSALPAGLVSRLKEGKQTTFGNGQVWTLQNGKPVQVK
jgi:hypothetical protein